jgi:hypothetical protein
MCQILNRLGGLDGVQLNGELSGAISDERGARDNRRVVGVDKFDLPPGGLRLDHQVTNGAAVVVRLNDDDF